MSLLEINYGITCELDTSESPHTTPVWSDMGNMFKNLSTSLNEVLYQATYLSSGGWGSTEVTGGQFTVTFTGDRKNGDPVNDYLFSQDVQFAFGEARKAKMRIRRGTEAILWNVTLANITDAGGDANQPNAVTLTVHGNGKPTFETVTQ
nr:MAG TPA: Lambda phage tail tube protein, TTP [Caudoviricetes sp.]